MRQKFLVGFNPRTQVWCDAMIFYIKVFSHMFQSTHPSMVRPHRSFDSGTRCEFQSTHPSMVRLLTSPFYDTQSLFQSTHPSMVRRHRWCRTSPSAPFQSTHPSMVRHTLRGTHIWRTLSFNPRTQVWCGLDNGNGCYASNVSIHAPKYGAAASPKSIITQELELCTNL